MKPVATSCSGAMKFWKMHGLGNDYIVIDNRDGNIPEDRLSTLAQRLCRRRFSVGADGLLLVYNSSVADAKMRIFNADGSEAEMCGNGIRCFAKYCYENNIVKKTSMRVDTLAGLKNMLLNLENGEVKSVKVDMGKPILEREKIPVLGEGRCIDEDLRVNNETFRITCLSVGNPHCIIFVDDLDRVSVEKFGPKIENHQLFPNRVNVEFAQVLDESNLRVRVWERGVGETFACGTGACASVVAGKLLGKTSGRCFVHLLGGDLTIEYKDKILMTGPAEKVYVGELSLEGVC